MVPSPKKQRVRRVTRRCAKHRAAEEEEFQRVPEVEVPADCEVEVPVVNVPAEVEVPALDDIAVVTEPVPELAPIVEQLFVKEVEPQLELLNDSDSDYETRDEEELG